MTDRDDAKAKGGADVAQGGKRPDSDGEEDAAAVKARLMPSLLRRLGIRRPLA